MKLEWRKVTTFNLDEYVGLAAAHPQSYHSFMWENLFRHVNIAKKNVHIPDGMTKDIPKFCVQYEKQICEAGGIDLQVLGIGTDGHIGFNEPTSSLASRTRIKTLTRQTVRDNARFFGSEDQSAAPCDHHGHRHDHGSAAMPAAGVWGEARPAPSRQRWKGRSQRSTRLPYCKCIRWRRLVWTTRRLPVCNAQITTVGCMPTSRSGSKFCLLQRPHVVKISLANL